MTRVAMHTRNIKKHALGGRAALHDLRAQRRRVARTTAPDLETVAEHARNHPLHSDLRHDAETLAPAPQPLRTRRSMQRSRPRAEVVRRGSARMESRHSWRIAAENLPHVRCESRRGARRRWRAAADMEAAPRFELGITVLQTVALPLGDAAYGEMSNGGGGSGAGNGTRTRDVHLGKVVLYQLSYSRSKPPVWYGSAAGCQYGRLRVRRTGPRPRAAPIDGALIRSQIALRRPSP